MRLSHSLAYAAAATAIVMSPQLAAAQQPRDDALAYLNLSASGAGPLSFASSRQEGGADIFTNVTITGAEEVFSADTMRLVNVRMENGAPYFDALVFEGLTLTNPDAGGAPAAPAAPSGGKPGEPPVSGGGGGSGGPESVSIERITFVTPNTATASLIANGLFRQFADGPPTFLGLQAYGFGQVSIEGLSTSFIDDSGRPVSMGLGALRLEGWGGDALAALAIEGASLSGEFETDGRFQPLSFELGSYEIRGVALDQIQGLVELVQSAGVEGAMASYSQLALFSPFVQTYDSAAINDVRLSLAGVNITADEMTANVTPSPEGLRYASRLGAMNVSFDPSGELGMQAMMGLAMVGLDRIEFSGDFVQIADAANDRLYSEIYELRMADAFTLDMAYDVAGVSAYLDAIGASSFSGGSPFESADPDQVAELLGPLVLNNFSMSYEDHGLATQLTALAAGFMPPGAGVTPGAGAGGKPGEEPVNGPAPSAGGLGGQVAGMIRAQSVSAPPGAARDLMNSFADATELFLNNPGRFEISMAPTSPVSVAELMALEENSGGSPDAILQRLNITVQAFPPTP